MNTEKFVKRVNHLPEYRCVLDDSNNDQFYILEHGDKLLCINTDRKELSIVEDEDWHFVFMMDTERDKELVRLFNKYSHSPVWDRPKAKWFKK